MKGVKFNWIQDVHKKVLEAIYVSIRNLLPLSPFNLDLKSHVYTDAFTVGFRYCLLQLRPDSKLNFVSFWSTSIKGHQMKYKPYDLEITRRVNACTMLHYYLSSGLAFLIHSNHKALDMLQDIELDKVTSIRIIRSLEITLQHNVKIFYCQEGARPYRGLPQSSWRSYC